MDAAASAQADIARFYDSIETVMVSEWMVRHNFPVWLAAACSFFQLSVSILIAQDGCSAEVGRRATGTMTGTRVAGCMGECIVYDTAMAASADARVKGLEASAASLVFASWVDNLYTVAPSPTQAITNMRVLEEKLSQNWRLVSRRAARCSQAHAEGGCVRSKWRVEIYE